MSFMKIGGGTLLPQSLPVALNAGEVFNLPAGQGIVGSFGSVVNPQIATNNPLSGQYILQMGQYSVLQQYDPGLDYWRNVNVNPYSLVTVSSDGTNFRLANTTGCPIGAIITTAGSALPDGFYGYVLTNLAPVTIQNGVTTAGISAITAPTASAGASLWNCIVGGQVSPTIGVSGTLYQNLANWFVTGAPSFTGSGGSLYTRPPLVIFTPPPNQGAQPYILPTAYSTISGGAVNAITVTNRGAGLLGLPGIIIVPQPGDVTGGGAIAGWTSGNGTEQGTGTLCALWPAYYGTAVTAVPSLTVPGGAAATAIMNFTITSFATGTAGVGYVGAGGAIFGGIVAGSTSDNNPLLEKNLSLPINPPITVAATTGVPTLAGNFGGVNYQAIPTYAAFSSGAAPGTAAVITCNVGGAADVVLMASI